MSIDKKKLKIIFFFLGFVFSWELSASLQKAKQLSEQGEFAESASLFWKELQIAEKKSEQKELNTLNYGLGYALKSLDLNILALTFFASVLQKGPENNHYFVKSLTHVHSIYRALDFEEDYFSSLIGTLDLNPSTLEEKLQDFYFYFRGKNLFEKKEYSQAIKYFSSVSDLNAFYHKALFYRAACEEALGNLKESITHFELLLADLGKDSSSEDMRDHVLLNLGRVYFEEGNFEKALEYYSILPRDSFFWLDAIFEGAWAFSLIKNPNSTLGNLHTVLSPFYFKKFNPEAHVLKAITLFKLCYYDEVKILLDEFQLKFKPIEKSLIDLLGNIEKGVGTAFDYVRDGNSSDETYFVIEKSRELSAYKKTVIFLENLEVEEKELKTHFESSVSKGLSRNFLEIKSKVLDTADEKIINTMESYLDELKDMFEQTILIEADSLLRKITKIKKELNIITSTSEEEFIGGMQKLVLGQALEYWPFDGEYWKDDLGGYVYNIPNLCKK
jgi:tetratricopeptide (TPR) repeat protein